MAASSDSKPEQPEELPRFPQFQVMQDTWNAEKVLQWIQKRHPNILVEEDDLNNFEKARIAGRAFLVSDVEFYQNCGLPRGVGLGLKDLAGEIKDLAGEVKDLADEVKEGKFTLDVTQTPANSVKVKLSDQTAGGKRKGKPSLI